MAARIKNIMPTIRVASDMKRRWPGKNDGNEPDLTVK
jgi:hypothetical protein